jgi:hypothetical protein
MGQTNQAHDPDLPLSTVLDDAHIKYGARCAYCRRKQKVLAIRAYPQNWNTERINICATCALAIASYLTKFRPGR